MRAYPLTSEELVDDVVATLDRVTDTVRERFASLADRQIDWQPTPRSWGVGQCLAHLARISAVYRPPIQEALRRVGSGGARAGGALRGTWPGRAFTRLNGPGGMKVRTPSLLRPPREAAGEDPRKAFLAEQGRLRALALEARGVDLDRARLVSPLSSLVRLTVGDALRVLATHELRHLGQAERVRSHPDFPA